LFLGVAAGPGFTSTSERLAGMAKSWAKSHDFALGE
jgi:hypothetical protein